MTSVLDVLGVSTPSKPLGETIRVRIDADLLREVDRIEAYLRGAGYRDISRSDIIRWAIASFVGGAQEALPEIGLHVLREEKSTG